MESEETQQPPIEENGKIVPYIDLVEMAPVWAKKVEENGWHPRYKGTWTCNVHPEHSYEQEVWLN